MDDTIYGSYRTTNHIFFHRFKGEVSAPFLRRSTFLRRMPGHIPNVVPIRASDLHGIPHCRSTSSIQILGYTSLCLLDSAATSQTCTNPNTFLDAEVEPRQHPVLTSMIGEEGWKLSTNSKRFVFTHFSGERHARVFLVDGHVLPAQLLPCEPVQRAAAALDVAPVHHGRRFLQGRTCHAAPSQEQNG